jgi:hypothetical protein
LRLRQEKIDLMKMFDLEKARKIVAEEQAKTLAAGNPIAQNDPKLNRALVREYANGKRERHRLLKSSVAKLDSGSHSQRNSAAD